MYSLDNNPIVRVTKVNKAEDKVSLDNNPIVPVEYLDHANVNIRVNCTYNYFMLDYYIG